VVYRTDGKESEHKGRVAFALHHELLIYVGLKVQEINLKRVGNENV
jgi:hypothetical protein